MHSKLPKLQFPRCVPERGHCQRLLTRAMTDAVFEAAINNRAPGQKDEATICCDTLEQVDGWQFEGINESAGLPNTRG